MGSARVLVVDDDVDIRAAFSDALAMEGFVVSEAAQGREALQLLRDGQSMPNVISLDLMMPVMSGWEMWDELKKDPALANIPVVVLSAGHAPHWKGPQPAQFLGKPVDLTVLIETVSRYC